MCVWSTVICFLFFSSIMSALTFHPFLKLQHFRLSCCVSTSWLTMNFLTHKKNEKNFFSLIFTQLFFTEKKESLEEDLMSLELIGQKLTYFRGHIFFACSHCQSEHLKILELEKKIVRNFYGKLQKSMGMFIKNVSIFLRFLFLKAFYCTRRF